MTPEAFAELHGRHPGVWALFERFALDRIARGFERYSADAILHRIRWETEEATGDAPKINNDAGAFYARMFREAYPHHATFFRTRASRADAADVSERMRRARQRADERRGAQAAAAARREKAARVAADLRRSLDDGSAAI